MPLDHRPFDDLDEADLVDLVENAVSEGTALDYKVALPSNQAEAKKEFLRDASSFANTVGGDLVFGVEEDGGIATGVPGIEVGDVEGEMLRIENMLQDGIDPRFPQHRLRDIELANGNRVFVLRVSRSLLRPHMVTFAGASEFYARNSRGKYRLDVGEIRSAMLAGPLAADRIRSFRRDRVVAVVGNDLPYPLTDDPKVILHLVPFDAFDGTGSPLDISVVAGDHDLRPLYSNQPEPIRWNLDGLYADDRYDDAEAHSSVQLFRSGIIEAVEGNLIRWGHNFGGAQDIIQGYPFERTIIDGVSRYLRVMSRVGVTPPVVVLVTLGGVRGYRIQTSDANDDYLAMRGHADRFDRDLVHLPDVMVDSFDSDVARALRPLLDAFWQAGGRAASENFDENGDWQRRD